MASIIAAAIVSPSGKVLVSRQYQEISRIQIEGLLSAFPKLLGTDGAASNTTREYTVIESGSYRYVFQPAEALFLVVLSTTSSNIIEDLAALRMLGRLLPERCPMMDEANVSRAAFEILFAFDEVVTSGQREIVGLEQISAILEMFSAEEELENERKKERERSAAKFATEKAHELRKMKADMSSHFSGGGRVVDDHGMGGSTNNNSNASKEPVRGGFNEVADNISQQQSSSSGRMGGGVGLSLSSKARRADTLAKALKESGGSASNTNTNNSNNNNNNANAQQQQQQSNDDHRSAAAANGHPVNLRIDEKISALLNREGGVSSVDCRGDLFISVDDASAANIRIIMHPLSSDFTTKSHPFMNKEMYTTDHVLAIKDNKPYPVGAAPLGVLRWRSQNTSSIKCPITVNCWPAATGASIEFEHENGNVPLSNVRIALPLPGVARAQITDCSCGSGTFDAAQGVLIWTIPSVNREISSGTLTLEIGQPTTDEHFFPARVAFDSPVSLAGVSVVAIQNVETGARVQYSCHTTLTADEYIVN